MRSPRSVVIVGLLVVLAWLGIGGSGGILVGKMSEVQKNDSSEFLPDSAESKQAHRLATEISGDTALPLIVVAERDGGRGALTAEDLAALAAFAQRAPGLSVGNGHTVADYLTDEQVPLIPSRDGAGAMVVLALDQKAVSDPVPGEARALGPVADAIRSGVETDLALDGLDVHVTGPAGFIADVVDAFAGIDGLLLAVALGVVLLILLVVYRSPILPFTVLLSAIFGLSLAGLVVYPLAAAGHLELSGQTQGILFILTVGAATDYALLLVARYKEELHHHESPWTAMKVAWRAAVEPIVASGTTVVLGLLCLMLADLGSTRGLGPVGALGILGAMAASLTLLPAMLVLGRRGIFWPAIPRLDPSAATAVLDRVDSESAHHKGWARLAALIGRRPRATWIVTALVLLALAAFAPTFRAHGITQSQTFLVTVDSVTGQRVLERHFDAGAGSPLVVIAPQDSAEAALAVLAERTDLTDARVGAAPTGSPGVAEGRVLLEATLDHAADSLEAGATVRALRADLDTVSGDILVGGRAAEAEDVRTASVRDFLVVAPTITLLVFLVLMVLLRAVVGPLVLMLANLLSFAATIGVAALAFNHVFALAGADPGTTLIGFVFLVALGVDYSIFLMTRAREETRKRGTRHGMLAALTVTGGVITSAGIVLAATFGALAVIPLLFLVQIAFIVAFGVLLDALVVRSLLVSSLVVDLGDRTWWPSRLARPDTLRRPWDRTPVPEPVGDVHAE